MIRYHAFAKAVEMRSISKAAEILGYSRSKLSNIIGSLEDELGLRLLEEEDDLVVLTESGKKLIPYCQQIVETEYQVVRPEKPFAARAFLSAGYSCAGQKR